MKRLISLVIAIVLFAACAPSPEEIAVQTQVAATTTSANWTKTPTSTSTPTQTATSTPTPTPTATPMPTPLGGSGQLIFTMTQCDDEWVECARSIMMLDLSTNEQTKVFEEGFFHDISPNGQKILVSQESNLFVMNLDGSNPTQLSENFYFEFRIPAFWLETSHRIVFMGEEKNQTYISVVNSDGTGLVRITGSGASPLWLYPSDSETRVYWEKGIVAGSINTEGVYRINIDGSEQELLDFREPEFSPTGEFVAHIKYNLSYPWNESLIVSKVDGTDEVVLVSNEPDPASSVNYFPGSFFWSPQGDRLFVELNICTPGCDVSNYYLYSPSGVLLAELPSDLGVLDGFGWSPDGRMIFLATWKPKGEEYERYSYLIDLDTLKVTSLDIGVKEYSWMIRNIKWIPQNPP